MAVTRDDEGRLVVVKRSGPGAAAARLRREAAALRVAAGAGCVELVEVAEEPDGGVRLLTAWGGSGTLATALPMRPDRVLGVARALAGSLVELHARGVVHGRITRQHVVLDGDRPVLCGLGGARLPGDADGPAPGDDVAALLALVEELLGDAGGDPADRLRGVLAAGGAGGAAAVADRLASVAEPRPVPGRESRRRRISPERRPPVRGLAVAGVAGVALLGLTVAVLRDGGGSDARPALPPATTAAPCRAAGSVDLDGDGCPDGVTVRDGVVAAGEHRWRVGEDGDLAAVADWDCDGRATAAVVRPATGEVWVYDGWATADRPLTARPGPAAPGATAARAVPGRPGCDRLEVTTADGGRRVLDLS